MFEGTLPENLENPKSGIMGSKDAKNHAEQERVVEEEEENFVYQKSIGRGVREIWKHCEQNYKDDISPPVDTLDQHALKHGRRTALFEAATIGDIKMVEFMLDNRAMINQRNHRLGETALFRASRERKLGVVQLLLERGALVDKTDI